MSLAQSSELALNASSDVEEEAEQSRPEVERPSGLSSDVDISVGDVPVTEEASAAVDAPSQDEPTAPADLPEDSGLRYEVHRDDTLSGITARATGNFKRYPDLAALNGIEPPYKIMRGMVLKLPAGFKAPGPPPAPKPEEESAPASTTAASTEPKADTGQIQDATESLGKVESMDGGFYNTAGGLIDALVPHEGQSGKLKLDLQVPVDASGTVTASFSFEINISRSDKGIKAKFGVAGEVKASKKVDLWVATVEAFAKAGVNGYIESQADTGAGVFELMGLALREKIASASTDLADAIFDKDYIDQTVENMDKNDYVEYGMSAYAAAGAGISGEDANGNDVGLNASGEGKLSTKTRLTRGADGGIDSETVNEAKATLKTKLSGKVKGFGVAGELSFEGGASSKNGATGKAGLKLEGTASLGGDDVSDMLLGASYLTDLTKSIANLIKTAESNVPNENMARMTGAMADHMMKSSGAGLALSQESIEAAKELKGVKVKVDYKLSASGSVDQNLKPKAELKLEKTNKFEYGGELRKAKVKVLVENLENIFSLKL